MAKLKSYQQPDRLLEALEEAGVTHGQVARVDVGSVHTETSIHARRETASAMAFFCEVPDGEGVRVRKTIQAGDGGPLSTRVFVDERLRLAVRRLRPWTDFHIEDAILATNGQTRLKADRRTRLVVTAVEDHKTHEVLAV